MQNKKKLVLLWYPLSRYVNYFTIFCIVWFIQVCKMWEKNGKHKRKMFFAYILQTCMNPTIQNIVKLLIYLDRGYQKTKFFKFCTHWPLTLIDDLIGLFRAWQTTDLSSAWKTTTWKVVCLLFLKTLKYFNFSLIDL